MPPIYSNGDLVLKFFPSHGWFWGQVTEFDSHNNKYHVKYCDGDVEIIAEQAMAGVYKNARPKIEEEDFAIIIGSTGNDGIQKPYPYPIGSRVCKEFPTHGWVWGTVVSRIIHKYDHRYTIKFNNGCSETINRKQMLVCIAPPQDQAVNAVENVNPEVDTLVGMAIPHARSCYSIGSFIGAGAFGRVYSIQDSRNPNDKQWVVKVMSVTSATAAPAAAAAAPAGTTTPNADCFYSMHTKQLSHLWGTVLPNLPNRSSHQLDCFYSEFHNETTSIDYRFLIMEQMQRELMAQLPLFVDQFCDVPSVKEIALGPLCLRLIDMVQEIHKTNHILINIKPEKLMVDGNFSMSPSSVKSKTIISTDDLAKSIRFVDFGLLTSFIDTASGKHMECGLTGQVQGTPLYASLNVHDLRKTSRRDDVYAMLYVIGEIVLCIDDLVKSKSGKGSDMATQSHLPWSQETDPARIKMVKLEEMNSIESTYFASMPTDLIKKRLFEAHRLMHHTRFVAEPNYKNIKNLLDDIRIPVSAAPQSGRSNENVAHREIENPVVGAFVASHETINRQEMAVGIASSGHQAAVANVEASHETINCQEMAVGIASSNYQAAVANVEASHETINRQEMAVGIASSGHQAAVANVEAETVPLEGIVNLPSNNETTDENIPDLEVEMIRLHLEWLVIRGVSAAEIEFVRLQLEELTLYEHDMAPIEAADDVAPWV